MSGYLKRGCRLKISIDELEIFARIGVYKHEMTERQPLIFDVKIEVALPIDDVIGSTVDYDTVANVIERVAHGRHYNLLEVMAGDICEQLLRDVRIQNVFIRISKPRAMKNARSAGVELVANSVAWIGTATEI